MGYCTGFLATLDGDVLRDVARALRARAGRGVRVRRRTDSGQVAH